VSGSALGDGLRAARRPQVGEGGCPFEPGQKGLPQLPRTGEWAEGGRRQAVAPGDPQGARSVGMSAPNSSDSLAAFVAALHSLRVSTEAVETIRVREFGSHYAEPSSEFREALRVQDAAWHRYVEERSVLWSGQ
jgi:hypothetical protein